LKFIENPRVVKYGKDINIGDFFFLTLRCPRDMGLRLKILVDIFYFKSTKIGHTTLKKNMCRCCKWPFKALKRRKLEKIELSQKRSSMTILFYS